MAAFVSLRAVIYANNDILLKCVELEALHLRLFTENQFTGRLVLARLPIGLVEQVEPKAWVSGKSGLSCIRVKVPSGRERPRPLSARSGP